MSIREMAKRAIGNNGLVRRVLYLRRVNPDKVYLACNPDAKTVDKRVKRDMIGSLFRYGVAFDEYFFFDYVNHREHAYRASFITECTRFSYFKKLNRFENQKKFDDKGTTYQLFSPFYGRDLIDLKTEGRAALETFVAQHPRFIAKINHGSCGKGVEIIHAGDYATTEALETYLLKSNHTICEELIAQSKTLSLLHPHSVNTVRMITVLNDRTGQVSTFHPFLKIGQNGSVVDNGGAGGILVKIDPQTGVLMTHGLDEQNRTYLTHPNTGVTLKGFQLPDWDQALKMTEDMAKVVPTNRYVGWDIAHTEKGWVMVEGNARGQFIGQQMCDKVGKRKAFDALIADIDLY